MPGFVASATSGCVLISFARKYLGVVAGLMGWLLIASGVAQVVPPAALTPVRVVTEFALVRGEPAEGPRAHAAAAAVDEDGDLLTEESEEAGGDGDDTEASPSSWRGSAGHWHFFATIRCLEHEHDALRGSDDGVPRVWHPRALGARGPPVLV